MELENNNNDFLALPQNLKLNEYDPDWARCLTPKYQNSLDCSDEYSKVKIDFNGAKLDEIFSGSWFSKIHSFISQNI